MIEVVKAFLEAASHVASDYALAAYSIAALLAIVLLGSKTLSGGGGGPSRGAFIVSLLVVAAVGISPVAGRTYLDRFSSTATIRITVIRENGAIVDAADVTSNVGGEVKRVNGGWEIDVPADSLPPSSDVIIRAEDKGTFSRGNAMVNTAGRRRLVAVTVTLAHDRSAHVRGIVVDARGTGVKGARVGVVGYDTETITTGDGGGFDLAAHAAPEERVLLHAQKEKYISVNENYPAGNVPARLTLRPAR